MNHQRLIISGATKGIGKATSLRFAQEGFSIAFCSRTESDVRDFEKHLSSEFGIRVRGFVADLTDPDETKNFGRKALDFLGGCDVLINNAGIYRPGTIEHEREETFHEQMAINLGSAYYLSKTVIPALKNGHRPHLFNMCSIASIKAYPNGASYCISKYAMLGLTRVLREELKPAGVCVTAVMPGAVLTESWGDISEPVTRFMRTSDVAHAIWNAYFINEHTDMEDLIMRPIAGDI